ncbi:calcium/sodium antiporter [Propionivibrio limicola]|uniref:calcium/sodium antiporter n=1 Tax=Propionivibrio limicola TaxID=167645 RepID=UPI00129165D5|nr:calcium/sodium antiporter [Propionivibrio limicola]
MNDYAVLTAGVACAAMGGELFVRGAIGLAFCLGISPGIVGATVAAFATSSPELSVSISASLAGRPQITLGDVLGSNVVNVALVLALALLIAGIHCERGSIKRDFPVALLTPVATAILLLDGELSRLDGGIMLLLFLAWLIAAMAEARQQRNEAGTAVGAHQLWQVALILAVGLAFLIAAGRLIVSGATGIALSFGVSEFVIGAIIVAVGTSVPELATTVISTLRGHEEVGLGTVLGSNIFNGFFIMAVTALIHPFSVAGQEVAFALGLGVLALVFAYPDRHGLISRTRGVLLLLLYATYVTVLLQR